ncbi:MAG: putative porin, partial [Veillonellaceae bacterium]|nr:putative porin [Veillonellaceae bacterium]
TRYEMAQMVARAMARQEMVDAQQQAQINRLADEFANELNSLGVRVTNLENRLGNVKLTGDARVRWTDTSSDNFDMRVRVQATAKVAENTNVVARLTSGNFGFDSGNDADLALDKMYVEHKAGDGLMLTGGRYMPRFGATGYWYDDSFDGVELAYRASDSVNASIGYGYAKSMTLPTQEFNKLTQAVEDAKEADALAGRNLDLTGKNYKFAQGKTAEAQEAFDLDGSPENQAALDKAKAIEANAKTAFDNAQAQKNSVEASLADAKTELADYEKANKDLVNSPKSVEMTYGTLGYKGHGFNLVGTYIAPKGSKVVSAGLDDIWGVGLVAPLSKDFALSGDYFNVGWKNNDDATFWVARVDFGMANLKKVGSFNLFVDYVDADPNSYLGGTGSLRTGTYLNNVKSWGVGAGVVVAENVKLEALRTFNSEKQDGTDLNDELTKVQVVYKF